MIVAIVIAAAVILGGIIVVAMGRGGELALSRPKLPSRTDLQSSSDVADYRPPAALIGYSAVATEHALALIARTIAERDAEIDWLRRRLAELQPESLPDATTEPPAADLSEPPPIMIGRRASRDGKAAVRRRASQTASRHPSP